jgi:hypothetical protein
MACPKLISKIRNTRNIGDSLITLNSNFYVLDNVLCDLKQRVESLVEVRTFFYYGPNQVGDRAATNMRDTQTNVPSNTTIENFVNSTNELNLALTTKENDQVNIIYQKTGYNKVENTRVLTGNATAQVISFSQQVPWSTEVPETFNIFAPTFLIWTLVHDGINYKVLNNFPKYTQSFHPL